MNSSFNYFSSPVKVNGFGKYQQKEVSMNIKSNPVEKTVNFTPYNKVLNKTITLTPQPKELTIIHLIISLLIWLISPVFIVGSIGVFIINTCINWVNFQVTLHREMNGLVERVRINSFMDDLDYMFNEIGYKNRTT